VSTIHQTVSSRRSGFSASQDQERRRRQAQEGSDKAQRHDEQTGREMGASQGRGAMRFRLSGHDRFTA